MPSYDLVFVVKPDLDPEAAAAVIARVTQRLTDQGAAIEHTESWGKRRMSYAIQRYREGHYVFTRFAAPGDRIPALRHELKILEDILRFSITRAVGPASLQKPAQPAPVPAASPAPESAPAEAAGPAPVPVE